MTLQELRAFFPHCAHTIYANHASISPLSTRVVEALNRYIQQRHETNIENHFQFLPVVQQTKERIAEAIGTNAGRVEFTTNTSSGLSLLAESYRWERGDRIAVPACEFPANVYPFMNLKRKGVEVDFIPHVEATFTLDDIERTLTPRTRLLTLSWVQFLSGFRTNLEEVGRLCKDRGVVFCVDAIQGAGALNLDVERSHIDYLACGCQKWMMATEGSGFIYVTEELQERLDPPAGWTHGPVDWDNFCNYELRFHPDARRFRLGTLNNPGIAAMHAALGLYLEVGKSWCEAQVLQRTKQLAEGLDSLGIERYGVKERNPESGIVTIKHPEPEKLFERLKEHGIVVSLRNRLLRFAPTYYNSPEEMEKILDIVSGS